MDSQPTDQNTDISWEASEYIHHEKNSQWFVIFAIVSVVLLVGMYLLLRDILSTFVIALMAIAVAVFAKREPKTLHYNVNNQGISIDDRKYSYESFRSFSLINEGAMESILLDPIQRFMPPLTLYFAPEDRDSVVDTLSDHLPYNERTPDIIDQFARKIRF